LSNFNVKSSLHERKAPPYKRKAPSLTTFWPRFCYEPPGCFENYTVLAPPINTSCQMRA